MAPLRVLDILLYRGRGFNAWFIKALTKSPYSHVALVANPEMNLGIESNTGHQSGVRAFDLRKLDLGIVDVYRLRSEYSVDHKAVISDLVSHLGAGYDYRGVIILGLLKILSLLTLTFWKPHNGWQRRQDYFCSEIVWEAFAADGLDLTPETNSSHITSPGDIAKSKVVERVSVQ
jgi:uncharacterized protein YycO